MDNQQQTATSETSSSVNGQLVFHAVYLPLGEDYAGDEGAQQLIFCDKLEALKLIKKYKKGRLKTFKSLEEAQDFSRNGLESTLPNPLANSLANTAAAAPEDKGNSFVSPKPQELTKFRKVVERGDLELVKSIVWENPRYLVSSVDTPAILHEGCRYNALHIAAKSAHSGKMCDLILSTISDQKFIRLFYGDDDELKTYVNRSDILLSMYLNTPDKGLHETPLHFATKFGMRDAVQILLSYPQCKKDSLNKYEQTPADIICSRKGMDDKALKKEIRCLLEGQYYVPVLRAEGNSLPPRIGEPFSPASPPKINTDPISPRVEVKAFAGPMTKAQALEFRKKWKTPPRLFNGSGSTPGKNNINNRSAANLSLNLSNNFANECNGLRSPGANLSFRLQDSDKGLERVGRELASEYHVSWKEYWPFLKDFADLRRAEGLDKLERFLRKQYEDKTAASSANFENSYRNFVEKQKAKEESIMEDFCSQFNALMIESTTEDDNAEFVTPPSSPFDRAADGSSDCDSSSDYEEMDLADDSFDEELFLEGKVPSKIDYAVFTAIPAEIDLEKYPFTYRWRHEMQLASKSVDFLRSPCVPRTPQNFIASKRRLFPVET